MSSHARQTLLRIDAEGLADPSAAPGGGRSLLLRFTPDSAFVLASGGPDQIDAHPDANLAERIRLPGVLIPGLVNAHTHLDLSHIGPLPHDPALGFGPWLAMVKKNRATSAEKVRASVVLGARLSLAGGVIAVGDIAGAGRAEPLEALRGSPLSGVCYLECFGHGARIPSAVARARTALAAHASRGSRVAIGLSPHAPYSAGRGLYEGLAATGAPMCTHLAESREEREFIATRGRSGQLHDLLVGLGVWDDSISESIAGRSGVAHIADLLATTPMLLAHVNDVDDADIAALARAGAHVVWCPRGHRYFGRPESVGPHRWRDMLAAGVNVSLGTDSIINLPPQDASRLSPLDDARLLFRDEAADPGALLRMITANPARALGLDPRAFDLAPGPLAGLGVVEAEGSGDAARAVMASSAPPRLLFANGFSFAEPFDARFPRASPWITA